MKTSSFQQPLKDGHALHVHRWLPSAADGKPRALVLIVHGMAEHAGRYARFARALTAEGFAVYAPDLPGHGRSARSEDERGHFADRDGWTYVQRAVHEVQRTAQREHPRRPLVLFGHSMGSFIAQHYLVRYGDRVDAAVLSGTHGDLGLLRRVGLAAIRAEALVFGARFKSRVGEQIGFKDYARRMKKRRTDFDWLSRDADEVTEYIADPHCGHRCSTRLWMDLLQACEHLPDPDRLRRIPKKLPVLMISGSDDPLAQGDKGPGILARNYQRAGLKDVTLKVYEGARHELLNETNRDEVTADVLAWTEARLTASA